MARAQAGLWRSWLRLTRPSAMGGANTVWARRRRRNDCAPGATSVLAQSGRDFARRAPVGTLAGHRACRVRLVLGAATSHLFKKLSAAGILERPWSASARSSIVAPHKAAVVRSRRVGKNTLRLKVTS